MKSINNLLEEFVEFGYMIHECPICGGECDEVEIDADEAYCSECDEYVKTVKVFEFHQK